MKLWGRSLMGILPVFFVLTAAVSLLIVYLVPLEIEWGYREEAEGLATSVAAFVEPAVLERHIAGGLSAEETAAFIAPIKRVIDTSRAHRIYILSLNAPAPVLDLKAEISTNGPPRYPDGLRRASGPERFVAFVDSPGVGATAVAYAKISTRRVPAVVGVEIETPLMTESYETLLGLCISRGSITLSVGLVCALIIGMVLRRHIRRLTDVTADIARGASTEWRTIHRGHIQEFKDLWNTVETITSVMFGGAAKSRNRLMNTELFFSTDQLLSALRQRRFQERTVRLSRVEFSLRAVGGAPPGSFHDLRVIGDAAFYITGKVSPLSDNFETGCVASAALRYISSHLESTPPEEAIKKAATLFSLTTLRLHLFRENDGELSISDYHLTDDHGETIRPSIVQCDIAGELSRGAYVSDLDPTSTKRIDRYLGAFGGSEETSVQSRVLAGLLNPNRSKTKGTFVLFRSVGFTNR